MKTCDLCRSCQINIKYNNNLEMVRAKIYIHIQQQTKVITYQSEFNPHWGVLVSSSYSASFSSLLFLR